VNNYPELFLEIINQVAKLAPGGRSVYLVGGAVRDYIINKPIYDWDFVIEGDVRPFSKKIADYFHGAYFLLDEERNVTRVIICYQGEKMVFDFATFRAESLNGDLEKRDFTINAMALNVQEPGQVIDPLGGKIDLEKHILRSCYPESFKDDPARVMRGIRLLVNLGLSIEEKTQQTLCEAVPLLTHVSVERQRDELFKIFDLGQTCQAITLLEKNGILNLLIPELEQMKGIKQSPPHINDIWEHTISTLDYLDMLLNVLASNRPVGKTIKSVSISAIGPLLKYQPQLVYHVNKELSPGRTRRAMLLFSALCHDIGKPDRMTQDEGGRIHFFEHERQGSEMTRLIAERLVLSNDEINYLDVVVGQHMRIHSLANQAHMPDRRTIHRYFRHTGNEGIDICFLSLADSLATWGENIPVERWSREIDICEMMLETWFEKKEEVINPPKLLSGNEIIKILQIEPGPKVGQVVLALKEAQGAGEVLTVQDAVNYIKDWYRMQVEGESYDDISPN
jgi:tRNA nucleotidyltransferase/poly(A) polymerase